MADFNYSTSSEALAGVQRELRNLYNADQKYSYFLLNGAMYFLYKCYESNNPLRSWTFGWASGEPIGVDFEKIYLDEVNDNIVNGDGEPLDPETLEPLPPVDDRTEGQKAFDGLKEEYKMTDEELYFWLSTAAAALLLGAVTGGMGGYLMYSIGLHFAAYGGGNYWLDNKKDIVDNAEKIKDYVRINLTDSNGDLETVSNKIKEYDFKYPVNDKFLKDQAAYYGGEISGNKGLSPSKENAVSSEISDYIYGIFSKSTSMVNNVTTGLQEKVLSYQDYVTNFVNDLASYTPVNSETKDILTGESDRIKDISKEVDSVFKDPGGNISKDTVSDYLKPSYGGVQEDIKDNGSNGGIKDYPVGGDDVSVTVNFDTAGIISELSKINSNITTVKELNLSEHDFEYGTNGLRKKEGSLTSYGIQEFEHEVDGKSKIVREGEGWAALYSSQVEHTYIDSMGQNRDILKGSRVDPTGKIKVIEETLNRSYINTLNKKKSDYLDQSNIKGIYTDLGELINTGVESSFTANLPLFEDMQDTLDFFKTYSVKVKGE